MKFKYLASSIALILTSGCALGPDYEQLQVEKLQLSDNYYGQKNFTKVDEDGHSVSPSLAAFNWKHIYDDNDLSSLINEALTNNLDLQSARANLRAAQAQSTSASAKLWPWLDVAFERERERNTAGTYDDTYNPYGLLSWELDLWGVNRRTAEAGRAEETQAQFNLYDLQVSLIASISSAYFDLLDIDNQLAITKATAETRREAVRILKLRKANGIISGIEVRQAEVSLAEALRKLPQLQQSQHLSETKINLLLGRAPRELIRSNNLNERNLPDTIPVGLPADLLLRRPDLRAAEHAMIAANARIGAAKGRMLPTITLTGEFGYDSSDLDNILKGGRDYWIATGGITAPIFNAGANMANYDASKEIYQQRLLAYKSSVLTALGEVSDGLSAYRLSQDQEQATQQLLTAANDYLRLATLQYRNGVLGYIDVLDAQRQQFDAELSLSQARRDRLKATSFMYKALGGGWPGSL